MLGLRARVRSIYLERIAINMEDARIPDEAGIVAMDRTIDTRGPDGLFSTLPLRRIQKTLKHGGFAVRISNSAGTFVCNSLFYRVMSILRPTGIPSGFVHLPLVKDSWTLNKLTQAVTLIAVSL